MEHIQVRDRGLTSQGVMDKNESALVIIKIATKLVSPYIVLSQEYYSRIFDPRKEVAPIIKKKKNIYIYINYHGNGRQNTSTTR